MNTQPEIIITALITLIASTVTGFLTWIFGRRKTEAEIAEISAKVYSGLVKDLESRLKRQGEIVQAQGKTIQIQDEKIRSIKIYVEELERLLLANKIISISDLEVIRNDIGI